MTKKMWHSRIDFRPNPADPKVDVVNLGHLLEFTTESYWVLGMVIRASLDEASLTAVDDLSRAILDDRESVIEKEVRSVLPKARKPGDVLALLSAGNRWSLHISPPRVLAVPALPKAKNVSVEKTLENYTMSLFTRDRVPARRSKSGAQKRTPRPAVTVGAAPAWLLPPTYVMVPMVSA